MPRVYNGGGGLYIGQPLKQGYFRNKRQVLDGLRGTWAKGPKAFFMPGVDRTGDSGVQAGDSGLEFPEQWQMYVVFSQECV